MSEQNSTTSVIGNRYQIEQLIGTGGMSVIYKAWDQELQRVVAIKLLRQKYSRSTELRKQFHQEARAAAALSHPNIVTIYDIGTDNNRIYLALEFIAGSDIKHYIQTRKVINLKECLDIAIQACNGVQHAHENGIIHCDIKPSNLLLNKANQLKITDFGLARILQEMNRESNPTTIWGSPFYLSPEQTTGQPPTAASDIYSIGVVLYELITGRPPFIANDIQQLMAMHRDTPPSDPRNFNGDITEELSQILLKALSKDPRKRYKSVTQMRNALFSVRQSLSMRTISQSAIANNLNTSTESVSQVSSSPQQKKPGSPSEQLVAPKPQTVFDWVTILIAFLATLAVAGLIPFWIYIYFNIPGK